MNVIANIKITTEDGRVLFKDERVYTTETCQEVFHDEIVNFETLKLNFKWIERGDVE